MECKPGSDRTRFERKPHRLPPVDPGSGVQLVWRALLAVNGSRLGKLVPVEGDHVGVDGGVRGDVEGPLGRALQGEALGEEGRRSSQVGLVLKVEDLQGRRDVGDDLPALNLEVGIDRVHVLAVHLQEFDAVRGRLYVPLSSHSTCGGTNDTRWIAGIVGFATTFDILQTFTPTASNLGFRVPYMPGGFQFADFFDTFYGDLANVGDWSQAQPLQCGYPTTAPSVGDYVEIEDPLPDPAPGEGRYYVTAVTHQGERRYGRNNIGALSGRDPAALPVCIESN